MLLNGYSIFLSRPTWRFPSSSDLLNLITLAIIAAIASILLISLVAGGIALVLSAIYLIRTFIENAISGIHTGKRLTVVSLKTHLRDPEVERKLAEACHGKVRGIEAKALRDTNQFK